MQTSVIADHSRRSSAGSLIVSGTLLGGFGAVFAAFAGRATVTDPNSVTPFLAALGGLFALIGVAMAGSGIRQAWLRHLFGVPTLTVPGGADLRLGEVRVARFHRQGGQPRAQQAPELSAELVGAEQVTYQQGTTTGHTTREICRHGLVVAVDRVSGMASGQVAIEVPIGVPPSLTLHHNEVVWSVRVHVRVRGVPDDTSSFTVTVLPLVAAEVLR